MRRILQLAGRARRLSCPRCGQRTLFAGWITMHERCSACGLKFEREPGYFVGAIYINYGATAVVAFSGFLILEAVTEVSVTVQIVAWCIFATVFPIWFYRYSKSIWLAFDYLFNPEPPELRVVRRPPS